MDESKSHEQRGDDICTFILDLKPRNIDSGLITTVLIGQSQTSVFVAKKLIFRIRGLSLS